MVWSLTLCMACHDVVIDNIVRAAQTCGWRARNGERHLVYSGLKCCEHWRRVGLDVCQGLAWFDD
jgi:hypothetical protein